MPNEVASRPPDGARVTTRDKVYGIERYPHFIAPADCTGTVKHWGEDEGFEVVVDQRIEGAEEWDNAITYPEPECDLRTFWDEWELTKETAMTAKLKNPEGLSSKELIRRYAQHMLTINGLYQDLSDELDKDPIDPANIKHINEQIGSITGPYVG